MAIKNRVNLQTTIDDNLPNNAEGTITPELHREVETDINDSNYNKITDKGLVGLKIYDPSRAYDSNEATVYNDGAGLQTWLSNKSTTGAFDAADWELTEGAVNEAPIDGVYYSRVNGAWADIGDALGTVLALQVVMVKSDLPAPITGVITLDDSVRYEFAALIDLGTDRIETNTNNSFLTLGSSNNGVTGTAAVLITVPSGSVFRADRIAIIGGVGQTGVLSNDALAVTLNFISFINLEKGVIINGGDNTFIDTCFFSANNTCVGVEGSGINYINIDGCLFQQFVNYGLDLGTATLDSIICNGSLFTGNSGSFNISGLANNGNIGKRARYVLNNFNGLGTFLENITVDDLKHEFIYNDGSGSNSSDYGRIYDAENVVTTIINTQGVYEKLNVTWSLDDESSRFNNTTDPAILQCVSESCHKAEVSYNVTGVKVGNGNDRFSVIVYEVGTPITKSQKVSLIDNSVSGTISGSFLTIIDKTKNYELYVANLDGTSNIDILSVDLIVKRLT
jgi:hypothetical protein